MTTIRVKRVYDAAEDADGYRVLVDRLWPRGRARDQLRLDAWLKQVAPSNELRRWFGHEPARWDEFRRRYFDELDAVAEILDDLLQGGHDTVTLLYGAAETRFNNAVALKAWLDERQEPGAGDAPD